MTTKSESVLLALVAALGSIGATVRRNEGPPEAIPAAGLVVVHDGDPGEPEVTMSPLTWHYEHRAEIDVFVEAQTSDATDAAFDAVKAAIGAALAADRTLGGACDWAEAMAPKQSELPLYGAEPVKAGTIPVMLHYAATDPLT